jgi:sodium-coupled neutral amino acid transporter 11
MAKARSRNNEAGAQHRRHDREGSARANEEDVGLLATGPDGDDDIDGSNHLMVQSGGSDNNGRIHRSSSSSPSPGSQASSRNRHVQPRAGDAPRSPRTPNRVRFDLRPTIVDGHTTTTNGVAPRPDRPDHDYYTRESFDIDEEDPLAGSGRRGTGNGPHLAPLLTGIEAPSVALANSPWGEYGGDVHRWAEAERARPKSGLRMAFMNMANSIIGAGIIGQPYAFKQAGLLAGIILLVLLTFMVDWTICLIVINSKLSGANSFQGTVEHCFGKPGLIAISIAQWAFAFGGMVAFGVIVGDSIPHVLTAVWPGLRSIPVLGLLADRRVVIAVFILGISYPLTLYRDISKVSLDTVLLPSGKRQERRSDACEP